MQQQPAGPPTERRKPRVHARPPAAADSTLPAPAASALVHRRRSSSAPRRPPRGCCRTARASGRPGCRGWRRSARRRQRDQVEGGEAGVLALRRHLRHPAGEHRDQQRRRQPPSAHRRQREAGQRKPRPRLAARRAPSRRPSGSCGAAPAACPSAHCPAPARPGHQRAAHEAELDEGLRAARSRPMFTPGPFAHRCLFVPGSAIWRARNRFSARSTCAGRPPGHRTRGPAAAPASKVRAHLLQVVQHGHHGAALTAPAPQQREQVGAGARVDGVEGLVEQDQLRVLQQHAREQHALELAGRQLADPAAARSRPGPPRPAPARCGPGRRRGSIDARRRRRCGPVAQRHQVEHAASGSCGRWRLPAAGRPCGRPAPGRDLDAALVVAAASRPARPAGCSCRRRWGRPRPSAPPGTKRAAQVVHRGVAAVADGEVVQHQRRANATGCTHGSPPRRLAATCRHESAAIEQQPRSRLCRAAGCAPWGEAPKALRGGIISAPRPRRTPAAGTGPAPAPGAAARLRSACRPRQPPRQRPCQRLLRRAGGAAQSRQRPYSVSSWPSTVKPAGARRLQVARAGVHVEHPSGRRGTGSDGDGRGPESSKRGFSPGSVTACSLALVDQGLEVAVDGGDAQPRHLETARLPAPPAAAAGRCGLAAMASRMAERWRVLRSMQQG
jgi:hypothetical protein